MGEEKFKVAIFAKPPDGYTGTTGDNIIDPIAKKLEATGVVMLQAATITDVDLELRRAWAMPQRDGHKLSLQIIGHGDAGQVQLGSSWMTLSDGTVPGSIYQAPYYVITSNPLALGFLQKHVGKCEKVVLAACNAGVAYDADDTDYPFNGRVLTYSLCEALRTQVTAAMDLVGPDDFDDKTGEFKSRHTGWQFVRSGSAPVWIDSRAEVRHHAAGTTPRETTIVCVTSALRPVCASAFPIHARLRIRLAQIHGDSRFRLAGKSTSLVIRDAGGRDEAANLFDNGRLLATASAFYEVLDSAQLRFELSSLFRR